LRYQQTAQFRTIQVYPKDLRALPEHPESEVRWHSGFPEGEPMLDLRRRQLITMLSGGAVTLPLAARAGRIGMLMGAAAADMEGQACIAAFRRAGSDSIF